MKHLSRSPLKRALAPLIVGIAIAALACGDDGEPPDGSTPGPAGTASTTPTPSPINRTEAPSPTDGSNASPSPVPEPAETTAVINLVEFAIQPQHTSARPGAVTFEVNNIGEIQHELIVIRTDLGHAELPREGDDSGADLSDLDVMGRTDPIDPGRSTTLTLELDEGRYVLICNLHSDGTSHYLSGMYDPFTVSPSAPAPETPVE